MPIKDATGDVVGVAQVINKLGSEQSFTANDEKVSLNFFYYILQESDKGFYGLEALMCKRKLCLKLSTSDANIISIAESELKVFEWCKINQNPHPWPWKQAAELFNRFSWTTGEA